MSLEKIMSSLKEFSKIPSVVGFEDKFIGYLGDKVLDLGYDISYHDGLLHVKNSKRSADLITTAHVDREGLVWDNGDVRYATHYIKDELGISFSPLEKSCKKIAERVFGSEFILKGCEYSKWILYLSK